jgi:hypothetical protein
MRDAAVARVKRQEISVNASRSAGAAIAAIIGAITAPAQAAGSDVVQYPKGEAYQSARIDQHYGTGVPAPRVRSFANARWSNPK